VWKFWPVIILIRLLQTLGPASTATYIMPLLADPPRISGFCDSHWPTLVEILWISI